MLNFYTIKIINPHKGNIKSFKSNLTDFIIETAENNSIFLPIACGIGNCTTCLSKVLHGKTVMQNQEILSNSLLKKNYILPCITTILSDIILITHQEKLLY